MYFPNFYCHIKDNLYFVVISKCACTSIKKYILDLHHIQYQDVTDIHDLIGNCENDFLTLVSHKDRLPNDAIRFAVYRDPVERAISSYHYLTLPINSYRQYQISDFDSYLELCKTHLSRDPLYCDEHIRRQVAYYKEDDVDFVVNIHRLNEVLLARYNIQLSVENKSTYSTSITNDQIATLKELYKDDYSIEKYANYIK